MPSQHGTVSTSVVSATFTAAQLDVNPSVEVLSRDGAGEIYFTVDGTDPVAGAANTFVVPAAIGSAQVDARPGAALVVKLIATVSTKYSVTVT